MILTAQAVLKILSLMQHMLQVTISGSDGPLTITGFDQSNDKLVILALLCQLDMI